MLQTVAVQELLQCLRRHNLKIIQLLPFCLIGFLLAGCAPAFGGPSTGGSVALEAGGFVYPGLDWDMTVEEALSTLGVDASLGTFQRESPSDRTVTVCTLSQETGLTLWDRPVELELTFSSCAAGETEHLGQVVARFCDSLSPEEFRLLTIWLEEALTAQGAELRQVGPEGTVWAQAEVDFWGIESFSTLSDLPEELLEKIDRGQRIAWERLQDTGGSDALPQSLPEGKVDQAFYWTPLATLRALRDSATGECRVWFDGEALSLRLAYAALAK